MNRYCNLANIGAFLNFKLRHVFLFPNMSQRQGTDQYQPSMPDMATAFNVTKSSISAAWDESWDISGDVWRTVPYVPYSWAILGGKCIINSIHTWSILFCNWSEAQNSQCFVDLYTLMNVDSSWCFMLLLWWRKATLTQQNGFGHHHTRITIYGVGGSSFFCLEAEVPAFYHFAMHINGWRVVNRDGRAVLWQWRFTFPWDAGLTWKVMSLTIQAHQVFCALTNRKFAACVVAAHDFGPMPIERSMAWTWDGTRGDIRAYLPILHLTHFWHWGGLATLIFGPVSDYIGRRKVFLFLQLLLVLSTTCCACVLATCLCWLRMVVRGYWARGCGS